MTHQTNEDLREKLRKIIDGKVSFYYVGDQIIFEDEIMSLIPQPEQLTCKWKEWSGKDTFNTDCCNCFFLENNFKYCPYCGKLIKVINEEKK